MNPYDLLQSTERQRVSDGAIAPILDGNLSSDTQSLVLVWSQLGDFDSMNTLGGSKKKRLCSNAPGCRCGQLGLAIVLQAKSSASTQAFQNKICSSIQSPNCIANSISTQES
jgi:hypothetical protein